MPGHVRKQPPPYGAPALSAAVNRPVQNQLVRRAAVCLTRRERPLMRERVDLPDTTCRMWRRTVVLRCRKAACNISGVPLSTDRAYSRYAAVPHTDRMTEMHRGYQ